MNMKKFKWEEERDAIRKRALEEHARLHKLFMEDRLSFERERKRLINEVINGAKDDEQKNGLMALQKSWDKKMRKAGSEHNRLVIAQHLFWKHIDEIWNPSIQRFSSILNGRFGPDI